MTQPSPSPLPIPTLAIARMEKEAAEWMRDHALQLKTSFRKVEALLASQSHYQAALGAVADRKAMAEHRHVIDFLFCELFPEYLERCTDFLNDRGQRLSELLTAEEHRRCEHAMFCAVVLAVIIHDDPCRRKKSYPLWTTVLEVARELAAQTFPPDPPALPH